MPKKYAPKKSRYNDLCSLSREMKDAKVKHEFDGRSITTGKQTFLLYDSELIVIEGKDGTD